MAEIGGSTMRHFETGATRDNDASKLDYEGFLSPLVLRRFAEYMHKHRIQKDGEIRASDNWTHLFGSQHYEVCIKSGWRHFMDWWAAHRSAWQPPEGIEEAICGLLFNAQAYLYALLKERKAYENEE